MKVNRTERNLSAHVTSARRTPESVGIVCCCRWAGMSLCETIGSFVLVRRCRLESVPTVSYTHLCGLLMDLRKRKFRRRKCKQELKEGQHACKTTSLGSLIFDHMYVAKINKKKQRNENEKIRPLQKNEMPIPNLH